MITTHKLKIHPTHYKRVRAGTKTFEIRDNDRCFQKGDKVELYYWNPDYVTGDEHLGYFVSRESPILNFTIGDVYIIDHKTVVFSLLKDTELENENENKI